MVETLAPSKTSLLEEAAAALQIGGSAHRAGAGSRDRLGAVAGKRNLVKIIAPPPGLSSESTLIPPMNTSSRGHSARHRLTRKRLDPLAAPSTHRHVRPMLKGQAKTDYQREYMRRRRAGLATAKPKPKAKLPWQPSHRMLETVRHWQHLAQRAPWRLRQPALNIIDGLDLATEEGVFEACRRHQAHLDARRAARKREAEEREAAKKAPARCSLCGECASPDRFVVGEGIHFICESCVAEVANLIARHRRLGRRAPSRAK